MVENEGYFLHRNSEQAADIFIRTWPTTVFIRNITTAYGSLCHSLLYMAVLSNTCIPEVFVNVICLLQIPTQSQPMGMDVARKL